MFKLTYVSILHTYMHVCILDTYMHEHGERLRPYQS